MRNAVRISSSLVSLLLLAACVTINIYFPAAEAQEAADKIVEDILGKDDAKAPVPAVRGDEQSAREQPAGIRVATAVINFLVPPVQAAQPDFTVNTPQIRKLQASMKARHAQLATYYQSGAIGFTNNAMIGFHDNSKIPLKEQARVKKLVAAENNERNQLYKAIAQANGHPEWEQDVRKTFAGTWIQQAQSGWWYQNAGGQWVRK